MANEQITVQDLAAAVVAADPELRDQLKGLVNDMIKHMRYTMRHGDPTSKLQLAKSITPQLLGAMKKVEAGEGDDAKREAYERMMAELRGGVDNQGNPVHAA